MHSYMPYVNADGWYAYNYYSGENFMTQVLYVICQGAGLYMIYTTDHEGHRPEVVYTGVRSAETKLRCVTDLYHGFM